MKKVFKRGWFQDMKPPSPLLVQADRRMNIYMGVLACVMAVYGLLLPANWREVFGVLGWPIDWAARTAPATIKAASVSPIPELVNGFFGLGSWAVVCFAMLLAWKDPLGERVRFAFSRGKPFWKMFTFIYFIGVPAIILGLWVAFFLPGTDPGSGATSGQRVFKLMVSSRAGLAMFGSVALVGVGLSLFFLFVPLIGPICLLLQGDRK